MPESQPLSLLRQYNIDKKEIVESNGDIILGESSWSKNICTNFLKFGTAKVGTPAEYYTLESLLFFLKNESLPHPAYIQQATAKNIPIVHELDRRDLLAYLNGEKDCCPSIDGCAPLEISSQGSDTLSNQLLEEHPTARLAPECAPSDLDRTKLAVRAIKTEVIVDCHNDLNVPPDHVNRTQEIIEIEKHCRSEIAVSQDIIEMGINSISAEIVEIARENVRNVNHLMVSVANRFDELISNIIDGKTNFKDKELVATSSIQFLYERLTKLRICYKTLDCSTKNFEKELVEHFGTAVIASAVTASSFNSADIINTTMKLRDKSIESVGLSGSSKSEEADTFDKLEEEHRYSEKSASLSVESCEFNLANNRVTSPEENVDQTEEHDVPLVSNKCDAADAFDPFAEEDHYLERAVNPVTELNECNSSDDSDSPPEDWMELDRWSKSSESDESEPPEELGELNLSDKITCICIICDKQIDLPAEMDVSSAMEAHLQSLHPSRSAPLDYATDSEEDETGGESDSAEVNVVLPEDFEVTFNRENALKYIRLSNGIYLNKQEKYICFVCGSYMPLEKHLGYHMKSKLHRKNVQEYAEYSEAAKKNHLVPVDPEIFAIRSGRLYCMECEYFLLDTHNFLSHVSEEHGQKLKLDFPIVKVGDCEFCALCDVKIRKNKSSEIHVASKLHYHNYLQVATVVQLNNIKYCSLCSVKLFTMSQFNSHVDDDCHILNLGTIQNMIGHLKFPSKR